MVKMNIFTCIKIDANGFRLWQQMDLFKLSLLLGSIKLENENNWIVKLYTRTYTLITNTTRNINKIRSGFD